MPLVAIKKIPPDYKLDIEYLVKTYPLYFKSDAELPYIFVNIGRIFNEKGDIVNTINKSFKLNVKKTYSKGRHYYCISIEHIALNYGIPAGYFIEISLIFAGYYAAKYPIFPNEYRYDLEDLRSNVNLKRKIEEEIKAHEGLLKAYEALSLLSEAGLENISSDLFEGLKRFEQRDFEGSIKFFRKVTEGLKSFLKEKVELIDGLKGRKEKLAQLLSKSYDLISNFGEHYRTVGGYEEALLAKEIAVSLCTYIAQKTRTGKIMYSKEKT